MKRQALIQYSKVIGVSLVIAVTCALLNIFQLILTQNKDTRAALSNVDISNITVIIDAGHGGEDGGAVGITGVLEKDINLSISKMLKSYFDLCDINAVLTRDEDILLYNENQKDRKKFYDLKNRLDFANGFVKPVFVSIHQNKFPIEKYYGLQVYFSKNNDDSGVLGELIQNNSVEYLQKDNKRKIKPAGRNIYLLKNLSCPAVLVECGFLSNANEEKLLNNVDYQRKLAFCIYKSVVEYISQSNLAESAV